MVLSVGSDHLSQENFGQHNVVLNNTTKLMMKPFIYSQTISI